MSRAYEQAKAAQTKVDKARQEMIAAIERYATAMQELALVYERQESKP